MDEWYANAQDEESAEGWEVSIPLEGDGFPFGTESRGSARPFGIATYNVGGNVTMSRLREILTAIKNVLATGTKSLPHVVILSEFRVASSYANNQYELIFREMFHGRYPLLLSPPTMRGCVACLVSFDVAPKKAGCQGAYSGLCYEFQIFCSSRLKDDDNGCRS